MESYFGVCRADLSRLPAELLLAAASRLCFSFVFLFFVAFRPFAACFLGLSYEQKNGASFQLFEKAIKMLCALFLIWVTVRSQRETDVLGDLCCGSHGNKSTNSVLSIRRRVLLMTW